MWNTLVRLKASIRKEHIGMAMVMTPFALALLGIIIAFIAAGGWMGVLVVFGIIFLIAWIAVGIHLLGG